MSAEGGTKAVVAALGANLGIAATKFVAFGLTGSSSMLAESIHSVADSGNQILLLVGGRRARRGATAEHPFGHSGERYIYAFIVSVVLVVVGGMFALYESYHKISHPEAITEWRWVPILVLVVAIGLESFSFRTAIQETAKVKGSATWVGFIRGSRIPELPVILLEDLAALIGLAFALIGIGLTLITGNGIWDGVGTGAIGLLLVVVAAVLAVETKSLLLGEAPTDDQLAEIDAAVLAGAEVERIIHRRAVHLGPDVLLVAVKVGVRRETTAETIAAGIDAIEARIRERVPTATYIYIEPDIYHATTTIPPAPRAGGATAQSKLS